MTATRIYRFGPYELSGETAELRKNGVRLKLQDQPFQILCVLLQHPGELVSREQLRLQLWPDGTFVDFEHGLNTAVKKIRDVLNDDPDAPHYIETIPRKGYRFIAPLNPDAGEAAQNVQPPRRRRIWPIRAPIFLAALAAVTGVTLLLFRELSSPADLQIVATKQLTFKGAPFAAIETDGRRVYYVEYGDSHLYSVPVGGGAESSYQTKFVQPVILHISPDGSLLLVKDVNGPGGSFYVGRIWVQPTNGSAPRPLGDIEAEFAAWSPDGKTIAFTREKAVYLTEDEGATYRLLAEAPGYTWWIRWSPDGQRLRFTISDSATMISSIWEVHRDGKGPPVALTLGGHLNTCCGIWTRDGRRFLFRERRYERFDYWAIEDSQWPFRSRNPFPLGGGGSGTVTAAASPLENTLFVAGYEYSALMFKFDLARHRLEPFLPGLSVENPAFSPDGKWMVICQVHTNESVLWRARTDGGEWQPLTDPKLYVHHARFSPDGTRIVLMAKWPDQPWKIYWLSAEGGALHELNAPVTNQADPNWMPDGQSILFGQPPRYLAEPETSRAIYIHNPQSNSMQTVPGTEGWFSPRISPDGRSFLALSIEEHKLGVYDFASSHLRVLLENPQGKFGCPAWSPDGESAYVTSYPANSLVRVLVREGTVEQVLSYSEAAATPECATWNVAPDGSPLIECPRRNNNIYALRYE